MINFFEKYKDFFNDFLRNLKTVTIFVLVLAGGFIFFAMLANVIEYMFGGIGLALSFIVLLIIILAFLKTAIDRDIKQR